MGWCSGTEIFDKVLKVILKKNSKMSEEATLMVIKALSKAMEDHDWDCQQDSDFYNHPLAKKARPDWHEHEDDEITYDKK